MKTIKKGIYPNRYKFPYHIVERIIPDGFGGANRTYDFMKGSIMYYRYYESSKILWSFLVPADYFTYKAETLEEAKQIIENII